MPTVIYGGADVVVTLCGSLVAISLFVPAHGTLILAMDAWQIVGLFWQCGLWVGA